MNERDDSYGWTPSGITPTPSGITRSPVLKSCEEYGCRVNAVDVDDLFKRYRELDFLYPAKLEALAPYWDEVKSNWHKALQAGDQLIQVVTADATTAGRHGWASITGWRSTHGCWNWQHLVSDGHPMYSRAVMLGSQAEGISGERIQSAQNWFRPDNRFPARVFGTLMRSVGEELACVRTYDIVAWPLSNTTDRDPSIVIDEASSETDGGIEELARRCRGIAYVRSEELDQSDLQLNRVDEIYRQVGLRRYRRIWVARRPEIGKLMAAAIAYRGPLGLNFSFLENRCDLLVDPETPADELPSLLSQLLSAATEAYGDFSPGFIPVVSAPETTPLLIENGGKIIRQYSHSAWLRDGFVAYYRHLEAIYVRLLRAFDRRGKLDRAMVQKPDQAQSDTDKDS